MDPSYFLGALIGTLLSMHNPYGAYAQIRPGECDPRGVCHPWYDDRRVVIQPRRGFYSPPQYYPPPPAPTKEETAIKNAITEFCSQHPQEKFCGMLEAYLEHHPNAR